MKQIQNRLSVSNSSTLSLAKKCSLVSSAILVSFASLDAQASCGTFGIVKGDIKIQSGLTKKLEEAVAGAKICSGDTVISGKESRAKILINDGAPSGKNELNISPDTRLVLENYEFNPSDNKKKVMLNILSGKVRATTTPNYYNDKSKDGQANTFEVRTKSAVAGVRGTDFMTSFDPASGKSQLVTFSGKVMFGQPGPNGTMTNAVQVLPGNKSEVKPGSVPAAPQAVPPAEMKKIDSESKADSTPAAAGSASAATTKKKDGGKTDSAGATAGAAGVTTAGGSDSGSSSSSSTSTANSTTAGATTTSATGSTDRAPASAGGAINAGSGMVDHGDLGGGAIFSPSNPSSGGVSVPSLSPAQAVAAAPAAPVAPTLPACAFCTAATQSTKSKVNVIIHLPGTN